MHQGPTWWIEERVDELKSRIADRQSASQIAAGMGTTRNAVIGKVHRLGLTTRYTLGPRPPTKQEHPWREPHRPRFVVIKREEAKSMSEEPPPIFDNPKAFVDLGSTECHFPGTGTGYLMLCCAAPVLNGFPYCAHHCAIAYNKPGSVPKAPRG